jgi:hypothetical protein
MLWWNDADGKNKVLEGKHLPMPLRSPQIPRGIFHGSALRDKTTNTWVIVRTLEDGCSVSFRNVGVLWSTIPIFVYWKPQNAVPQLRALQNSSQWNFNLKSSSLEWTRVSVWQYTLINAGVHIVYILIFPRVLVVHCVKVKELHTECSANNSWSLKISFKFVQQRGLFLFHVWSVYMQVWRLASLAWHTHTHTHTHTNHNVCCSCLMNEVYFFQHCLWELSDLILFKLRQATICFVMSVRLSVRMEHLGSYRRHFHDIWYLSIFRKSVEKIQVSLTSDMYKYIGYYIWRPMHIYDNISRNYSDNEKHFRQKL